MINLITRDSVSVRDNFYFVNLTTCFYFIINLITRDSVSVRDNFYFVNLSTCFYFIINLITRDIVSVRDTFYLGRLVGFIYIFIPSLSFYLLRILKDLTAYYTFCQAVFLSHQHLVYNLTRINTLSTRTLF